MILRPRLKNALSTVLLLLAAPLAHGGAIDRFPLKKTITERPTKVAVATDHVWIAPEQRGGVAKVGLDGTVVDTYALPGGVAAMALVADRDGSVWYASYTRIGRVTPSGESIGHSLPQLTSWVHDMVIGSDDNLWLATSSSIFRVTRAGNLREFPMSPLGLEPSSIAVGPDYNLWIAFGSSNKIGKMTPSGTLTQFTFASPYAGNAIVDISGGADGSIWFATRFGELYKMSLSGQATLVSNERADQIVAGTDGYLYLTSFYTDGTRMRRLHPTTHQYTDSTLPTQPPYSRIYGIGAGPSGVWWAETEASRIGRLTYEGSAARWPFLSRAGEPGDVTAGPDGSIWTVQTEANRITKRSKNGEQTVWELPAIGSRPMQIVQGPDEAMYFTEEAGDQIGRIGPDGVLTEFPVPTPYKKPTGITLGPDGNLWFTLATGDKVGRMTPAGVFTEFLIPGAVDTNRTSIATGPDGNLWFTQKGNATIGRMTTAGAVELFPSDESAPHSVISFNSWIWFLTDSSLGGMATVGHRRTFFYAGEPSWDLTGGPDRAMWVTRPCCGKLVRIDPVPMHRHEVPLGPTVSPRGIATGADGHVWFADASSEALFRVTVDKPITALPSSPICLTASNSYSGVVASFTDSDPAGKASDFEAWIEWAGGVAGPGSIVPRDGGGFNVIGSQQYSANGTYPVWVSIRGLATTEHVGGASAFVTTTATTNPGILHAPVQLCRGRTATASVSGTIQTAMLHWEVTNAIRISEAGSTLTFQPDANATSVTIRVTIDAGNACPRTLTTTIPVSGCPSSGDMDGDGRAEIVWRNAPAGGNAFWRVNGAQVTERGYLPALAAPWRVVALQDIDGDGRADILWYNPETLEVRAWYMNGPVVTSTATLIVHVRLYTLEGAGDFNGDSRLDLLMRNRDTNETYVWLLGRNNSLESVLVAKPPMIWQLQGSGDFNGDGKADLLWRNTQTHEAAIWLMNGGTIASAAIVASPHSIWSIRGMGDVNGDGRYDIIWRNTQSSEVVAWLMNGAAITGTGYLATPSPDWDLKAIGDFDGDGRADAMWRNGVTGDNAIWLLNGTSIKAAGYVDPVADLNWVVAGPR